MTAGTIGFDRILDRQQRAWNIGALRLAAILAVVLACAIYVGLFDWERLADGVPSIARLLGEMFPPDFNNSRSWLKPVADTLAMSVAGTALAVVLSIPCGFLAARNTAPHPLVYQIARGVLNALRAIPELIMGIIFVAAVGFGALPGVLALGLHSVGMVGKFFAEAIEHADGAPIEAARAAGATPLQVLFHGVLPQVLPQMADISVYRWEYNFRASTVMGMVGAGGIGMLLWDAIRSFNYGATSAMLIILVVVVSLLDLGSAHVRKRFI